MVALMNSRMRATMKRQHPLLLLLALFAIAADQGPVVSVRQPTARETADKEFLGRVEPVESVEVHGPLNGTMGQVHCKAGDDVKKGDLLFQLDAKPLNRALEAAQANVKKKEAAVEQATKKLDKLKQDKAKDVDLDKAQAQRQVAEVFLKLARADVEQVQSDLDQVQDQGANFGSHRPPGESRQRGTDARLILHHCPHGSGGRDLRCR